MDAAPSNAERFHRARERAGLSVAGLAARAACSQASVWDLESYDDELTSVYSLAQVERLATAMGTGARDLLGIAECRDPFTPADLASAIRQHCRGRGITIDDFAASAGWDVTAARDAPELFLTDVSVDGVRDVCRELGTDWKRLFGGR